MATRLGVAESRPALDANVAEEFLRLGVEAIADHGAFRVALAGGETPRGAYEQIAATWRDAPGGGLAWERVHIYWSDERMVPREDPRSNFGMVKSALLSRVPLPPGNIHPIEIDAKDPEAVAAKYERTLRHSIPLEEGTIPRFDLVLLGMGADGHTASLFPGDAALAERSRLAVAARHPDTGEPRVTMTFPVLNRAAVLAVVVAGSGKAAILERAVRGAGRRAGGTLLPVEMLRPEDGTLLWMADEAAAPWSLPGGGGTSP